MNVQDKNLEKTLSLDLDHLIKSTKSREDTFIQLINLADSIISVRSQIANNIYIHDQIHKYRKLVTQIKTKDMQMFFQVKQMSTRYKDLKLETQDLEYLLRRICKRLLDIILNTINQVKIKAPVFLKEYIRLKIQCQKIMEKSQYKSHQLIICINEYQSIKINKILDFINSITSILQNGNQDQLNQLQLQFEDTKQNYEKNKIVEDQSVTLDFTKKNRIYIREKLNLARDENIGLQKINNNKLRNAKKMIEGLRDVMEISKQDYIQEWIGRQDQIQTLINSLLIRNKENRIHISLFSSKRHKFQQKTSHNAQIRLINRPFSEIIVLSQLSAVQNKQSFSNRRRFDVKMKQSTFKQRTVNSELFKRENLEQSNKYKIQRYEKQKQRNVKQLFTANKQHQILKSIQQVTCHEEIRLRDNNQNCIEIKNHLPVLNKRTYSIDQNWRAQCQPETTLFSKSVKISQSMRKKNRFQKAEIFPTRIKIELNSEIVQEVSIKPYKLKRRLYS